MAERFGAYAVFDQLGVGGVATVHLAELRRDGQFRKRVALKRLLPHLAEDEAVVRSFIDEGRLSTYLRHPNIAQTFDFGIEDGTYFMAMELVPGPTLEQLILHCRSTVGIIPYSITQNILVQLCEALDYAHNLRDERGKPLGIVHRDISPSNVVISNTGVVKLIDFGLAKAKVAHQQTQIGMVKGKFSYIAPEYLDGKLDHRADLWALGLVAHELLTNERVFEAGTDLEVLERVTSLRIPKPSRRNPDVPAAVESIVMTALERDPARRWQSAAAMQRALRDASHEIQQTVTNAQVVEWVDWTFEQLPAAPRDFNSGVTQLIAILERDTSPTGVPRAKEPHRWKATTPTGLPVTPSEEHADRPRRDAGADRPRRVDADRPRRDAGADRPRRDVDVRPRRADGDRRLPMAPERGGLGLVLVLLLVLLIAGVAGAWQLGWIPW